VSKSFYPKKIFFGIAPSGSYRIGSSGKKKITPTDLERGQYSLINFKNAKNDGFDKNNN
jgi:hypothetical protein